MVGTWWSVVVHCTVSSCIVRVIMTNFPRSDFLGSWLKAQFNACTLYDIQCELGWIGLFTQNYPKLNCKGLYGHFYIFLIFSFWSILKRKSTKFRSGGFHFPTFLNMTLTFLNIFDISRHFQHFSISQYFCDLSTFSTFCDFSTFSTFCDFSIFLRFLDIFQHFAIFLRFIDIFNISHFRQFSSIFAIETLIE